MATVGSVGAALEHGSCMIARHVVHQNCPSARLMYDAGLWCFSSNPGNPEVVLKSVKTCTTKQAQSFCRPKCWINNGLRGAGGTGRKSSRPGEFILLKYPDVDPFEAARSIVKAAFIGGVAAKENAW